MENLNFLPDEHSYVEPWIEPEQPKVEEEKEDQAPEENSKGAKTIANAASKDPKKMNPAEKKKWEEEQKKKEKEESENTAEKLRKAEQEAELARKKEEERRQREIEDYFDFKTTYEYLNRLGKKFGTVYVNDAPLECLSTSNSVAELKCDRKVMGITITEEIRKLSQFFMKDFPFRDDLPRNI